VLLVMSISSNSSYSATCDVH